MKLRTLLAFLCLLIPSWAMGQVTDPQTLTTTPYKAFSATGTSANREATVVHASGLNTDVVYLVSLAHGATPPASVSDVKAYSSYRTLNPGQWWQGGSQDSNYARDIWLVANSATQKVEADESNSPGYPWGRVYNSGPVGGTVNVAQQSAAISTATLQSAAAGNGNGTAATVTGAASAVVAFTDTMVGTLTLNGAADGSNYGTNGLPFSQVGGGTIATSYTCTNSGNVVLLALDVANLQKLRAPITNYSSGSLTVTVYFSPLQFGPRTVNMLVNGAVPSTTNPGYAAITDGTNKGAVLSADNNALAGAGTTRTYTLTLTGAQSSAALLTGTGPGISGGIVDTSGFASYEVQVIGLGSGVTGVNPKGSGDQSTWMASQIESTTTLGSLASLLNTVTTNTYGGNLTARYLSFQLASAETSGTTTVIVTLRTPRWNWTRIVPVTLNSGIALASAARTTTTTSNGVQSTTGTCLILCLNVTAASGTGGLQLQLLEQDPVSSGYAAVTTLPTAITATGQYFFYFGPGITSNTGLATSVQAVYNLPISQNFEVKVTHGDASSYTYSVGWVVR